MEKNIKKSKWDIVGEQAEPEPESNPDILQAAQQVKELAQRITAATKNDQVMAFEKDIDINDHKARYQLTKDTFLHKIKQETGAMVTAKGKYYPDARMATKKDPALYLHVEAPSKESMDRAMEMIDYIIDNPILPILDADLHGLRGSSGRVHIGILHADNLNVRAKVLGPNGAYLRHIMMQTGTKAHLRGKGSGFMEPTTGKESEEELYIYIT